MHLSWVNALPFLMWSQQFLEREGYLGHYFHLMFVLLFAHFKIVSLLIFLNKIYTFCLEIKLGQRVWMFVASIHLYFISLSIIFHHFLIKWMVHLWSKEKINFLFRIKFTFWKNDIYEENSSLNFFQKYGRVWLP